MQPYLPPSGFFFSPRFSRFMVSKDQKSGADPNSHSDAVTKPLGEKEREGERKRKRGGGKERK